MKVELTTIELKALELKDINNFKIPWCIATPVFSVGTDIPEIQCVTLGSVRKSISNTINI